LTFSDLYYTTYERFSAAGSASGHYFYQDLWAASYIYKHKIINIVDIGSRLDGFVAHVLPFCRVKYVDIRPLTLDISGFEYTKGSILDLPFGASTVKAVSCLHVIEHIGLGRYGDLVDPYGYMKAANEIVRVMAPGGKLILGVPVGVERLCFDAHRVFDPQTVVNIFTGLELVNFSLISDEGSGVIEGASFEIARKCDYGCGLFILEKKV
jgi:SAM-dependent methyltransferase